MDALSRPFIPDLRNFSFTTTSCHVARYPLFCPLRSGQTYAKRTGIRYPRVAHRRLPTLTAISLTNGLREAESILLWLGIGAAEQLLLTWMIQMLKDVDAQGRLSVIQFTRAEDRDMEVWGLGLLNPEQIKRRPTEEHLAVEAVSELEHCWAAVTSADPAQFLSLLSEDSARFPFLRPSLQPLLGRYPDHQMGINRWGVELLKYVKEKGPRVASVIGYTIGYKCDADQVGDAYLFSRLRRLADPALPFPLLTLSGDSTTMRGCEVALTEAGAAVLAGRANAVKLNGIDDWVLGVHLDSAHGSVWYREDGAVVA